ncbi:uridine kinase [Streptomyces albidoflavus]
MKAVEALLLTLTGGAGAGKTTLAAALVEAAPIGPVRVLHGDDYYVDGPERGVWVPDEEGVSRLDVGDPRSVDEARLAAEVAEALADGSVVIVEGLFARRVTRSVAAPDRFDVFVDLPADLRLARKIRRKCLGEGFPLDVLLRNYLTSRRAAHERHVEPERAVCDLVVEAVVPVGVLASRVWVAVGARSRPGGSRGC